MMNDLALLRQRLGNKDAKFYDDVVQVVDCFRAITGRHVNYSTLGSLKLILFQLRQGHRLPQFGAVFDYKYRQFKGTDMEKYIAIDTFCRQEKFENSLERARQEWLDKQRKQKEQITPSYHKRLKYIHALKKTA